MLRYTSEEVSAKTEGRRQKTDGEKKGFYSDF